MDEKTNQKNPKIWFGADVSKDTFDVSLCLTGERIKDISSMRTVSFERTKEGVEEFKAWAIKQMVNKSLQEDDEFGFVMEATGSYSVVLAKWLFEVCPKCIPAIADPKSVNAYGKSLRLRNKTDKIDAAKLALYGVERNPSAYIPQSKEYEVLKELVRQRKSLVNMLTAAKVHAQETSQVKAVIMARKKTIRDLEKTIIGIESAIKRHVNEYPTLKEQVKILTSIPGVGLIVASTMIGELGDVHRFSSSKKIAAYAGVSPRRYESGTSVKGKTRMCKEGQGRIRQALYLSALASMRGDNGFSRFYSSLVIKGKTKMAALGAIMRKMLCVMRRLIIDKSLYNDAMVTPININ